MRLSRPDAIRIVIQTGLVCESTRDGRMSRSECAFIKSRPHALARVQAQRSALGAP